MKILFVHYKAPTFAQRDLEILASRHHVRAVDSQLSWRYLVETLRGILWCDLVFCWFGSFRALLPALMAKVFRKRCVVVAGGYDVASEPEIDYGNMRGGIRRLVGTTVFRLADRVTTVSRFNTEEARHNANIPEEKIDFIYHGFPGLDSGSVTKDNLVITVGSVNATTLKKKGIDLFLRAVSLLPPSVECCMIGQIAPEVADLCQRLSGGRVHFTGYVAGPLDGELHRWLSRAKVYVQISRHEAFGCAVAEAMLHKCVPVVSRQGALPEVVGDCGLYVDDLSPEGVAQRIQEALASDLGERARKRVQSEFPLALREQKLLDLVGSLRGRSDGPADNLRQDRGKDKEVSHE